MHLHFDISNFKQKDQLTKIKHYQPKQSTLCVNVQVGEEFTYMMNSSRQSGKAENQEEGWCSERAGTACASVSQVNTNLSVFLLFALTRFPPPTSAERDRLRLLLTHREGTSQSRKQELLSSHSRDLPGTLTTHCFMLIPIEVTATFIMQDLWVMTHFLSLSTRVVIKCGFGITWKLKTHLIPED